MTRPGPYSLPYIEPLSDARTSLAGIFSILLGDASMVSELIALTAFFCQQALADGRIGRDTPHAVLK